METEKGWHGESKRHSDAAKRGSKKKELGTTNRKGFRDSDKTKIVEIFDTHFAILNSQWKAGLEDSKKEINLAAMAEIVDLGEIDSDIVPVKIDDNTYRNIDEANEIFGLEDEYTSKDDNVIEYPFVVQLAIMVHPDEMSPKFIKDVLSGSGLGDTQLNDMLKNRPISLLYDAYSYGGGVPVSLEGVTSSHTSNVDSIVRDNGARKGGVARYFKTDDDAEEYLRKVYAYNLDAIMILVGFTLDRQINLVGTTGWDIMEYQARGKKWI